MSCCVGIRCRECSWLGVCRALRNKGLAGPLLHNLCKCNCWFSNWSDILIQFTTLVSPSTWKLDILCWIVLSLVAHSVSSHKQGGMCYGSVYCVWDSSIGSIVTMQHEFVLGSHATKVQNVGTFERLVKKMKCFSDKWISICQQNLPSTQN